MAQGLSGPPDLGGTPPLPDVLPFVYRVGLAALVFLYQSLEGVAGGLLSFESVSTTVAVYVVGVAVALLAAGFRPVTTGLHRFLILLDMAALAVWLPHDPHHALPSLVGFYWLFAEYGQRCSRRLYLEALAVGALALATAVWVRKFVAAPGFGPLEAWSTTAFVAFAASGLVAASVRDRLERERDMLLAENDHLQRRDRSPPPLPARDDAAIEARHALDAERAAHDATQQRLVEATDRYRRSKRDAERYLFAVSAARVSSFAWNIETDHLEFDHLFEPLLGQPKGTVRDRFRDFLDVVHPEDRERVSGYVRDCLQGGAPDFRVQYRVPQPGGGGTRWIRGVGRFLRDDQGDAIEASGAIQDVTVEVEAMLALERAREEAHRYRLAVEAAHVAAYTYDVARDRFEVDNLFEQVLGFDVGTFDGSMASLMAIVHPEDREALAGYIAAALADREDYSFECRTSARSGRVRWVRTSGRIVRDAAGDAIRASGVSIDISVEVEILTSLEQRQKELERANRELDDFTYIASHDLKEPLRGIHNFARFLHEDYGAKFDDEGRHMLSTLGAQAERMQRLIDDLLQIARLGRAPLQRDTVALDPVLDDVLASLDFSIRERKARIVRPAPLPAIECDRVRVGEVFRNLVVNALKYNVSDAPEVTIACDDEDGNTVFRVADNGIGIPPEHRSRVFQPFKRLHAREAYGGGTGAGLTIVKKIVEAHDGRIWIEDAPGSGTTFRFTLEGGESRA